MSSTKYQIENFTSVDDFGLWHLKMQTLLVQYNQLETLKGSKKMDVSLMQKEKTTMIEKAHNAIRLSLGDKVIWKVLKDKTITGVWSKLEGLYMTKSLVNRLYLK